MATGTIILDPAAASPPDNSTNNAPAGIHGVKSTATAPSWHGVVVDFDASTKEWIHYKAAVPADYSSSLVAKIKGYMVSATSGNIVMEVRVGCISATDASVTAKAYGSANTSSATAVPASAGTEFEVSVTLTNNDSPAAGDVLLIGLARDAANGSDTASGDYRLMQLVIEYTTT